MPIPPERTSKDDHFLSYSVHLGGAGDNKNPETVALIDQIDLTVAEHAAEERQVPKSVTLRIIAEATDVFVSNLQKALAASDPHCTHTYDPHSRTVAITPHVGTVTKPVMMRLLGILYKQQAITFNDVVVASNTLGTPPPPKSLDTITRDLSKLWIDPHVLDLEKYTFTAPYYKFNPNLRLARGPTLVNTIELNLERGTRKSPYITLRISHRATDVFVANLQAALQEKLGGRQNYNAGTRNLAVIPPGGNISKEQMSRILEVLYETKAISYNDQSDACDALKLEPIPEDGLKGKEKRDLTDLYK